MPFSGARFSYRVGFVTKAGDWDGAAGGLKVMQNERITIPARRGKATQVGKGRIVTVINTFGEQVVDTWAFNSFDIHEFMSMEHSRAAFRRVRPKIGDSFVTNHRRPILTVMEDTTPGVHDTLIAACDRYRYQQLGCATYHDNCTDNLEAALKAIGLVVPETPCPLNLFQNTPAVENGEIDYRPPVSKPNQYIKLRCEMDLIIVFSACPQDMLNTNGAAGPTDAHFEISD
jgi:uncharacterized protein YcgI (DUF1989 family)